MIMNHNIWYRDRVVVQTSALAFTIKSAISLRFTFLRKKPKTKQKNKNCGWTSLKKCFAVCLCVCVHVQEEKRWMAFTNILDEFCFEWFFFIIINGETKPMTILNICVASVSKKFNFCFFLKGEVLWGSGVRNNSTIHRDVHLYIFYNSCFYF